MTDRDRYALDSLRKARATALSDSEGFSEILFALERVGTALSGQVGGLSEYKPFIKQLALESPLSAQLAPQQRHSHTEFDRLYEIVRSARNEALHHGAFARHITRHAVELCLLLEDGLMSHASVVADFMVRDPVCAELWQPMSLIRQQMLANSFSYLPVKFDDGSYGLVADLDLARMLARSSSNGERRRALSSTLADALAQEALQIPIAGVVAPEEEVRVALERCSGKPLLVLNEEQRLIGIVTPFDLL